MLNGLCKITKIDTAKSYGLLKREFWFTGFTYFLFVFSLFSITGVEFAVIALYLLAAYHRLRSKPEEYLPRWIVVPFLLWVAALFLSALTNPDPLSNLATLRHQYRILLPFVLLPALAQVNLERLLKVYLIVAAVMAVYGVSQSIFAFDLYRSPGDHQFAPIFPGFPDMQIYRARGNFAGPGSFANHMMMVGLLCISIFFSVRGKTRHWWALGAAITAMGLLASFGRSAWIGMFVGLLVLSLRLPRRWAVTVVVTGCVLLGATAMLIESGWLARHSSGNVQSAVIVRLTTSGSANDQSAARLALWQAGLRAIKDHPLLGVGFKNRAAFRPYMGDIPWQIRKHIPSYNIGADLHNIYLQIAFDLGLLGLAAYLAMWGVVFFWNATWIARAREEFRLEAGVLWGTTAALTGAIVDGFFHDSFFSGNANATILMFMGLSFFAGLRIKIQLRDAEA
ncbi:MAG: O-antigen ligase family protein [SAR324 cluster bacterium]|nr:O-antigen ligase family protein [SAR324 cluster bacterium]